MASQRKQTHPRVGRRQHRLVDVARRTGFGISERSGDVFVSCPMPGHDDRTPSMLLHLDTDRYHCFGCGAGGDAIQWVKDVYGLSFPEALALLDGPLERFPDLPELAEALMGEVRHAGTLSEAPDRARSSPERVAAAMATAWRYYSFPRLAERGVDYLADRGIEIAGELRLVGHTPYLADGLTTHLCTRGFAVDELVDAGLTRRRGSEPLSDAFQRRVILPVRGSEGEVVGLIGRATLDSDRRAAKYLNSPHTVIYDKSQAVYDPVPQPLAADGQVVVVEGTLDALAIVAAARAAGVADRFRPVSTSGVAFSDTQLEGILALHPRAPVIALDGDEEGHRAAAALAARMAERGREAALVTWPAGSDPASWLAREGAGGLCAVTRRGCLDGHAEGLRPHHGGREAAGVLMKGAGGDLNRRVDAALAPITRMSAAAGGRYAAAAAAVIAPAVVNAALVSATDGRSRTSAVVAALGHCGARLPDAAQPRFLEAAVSEIEHRELAPGPWAQRQIAAHLSQGHGGGYGQALGTTVEQLAPSR